MGLLTVPAITVPTSDHRVEAQAACRDDERAPGASGLDEASYSALLDALADLKEFHELEASPGRASWLGEIIEDFGGIIARLEPPDERATPM